MAICDGGPPAGAGEGKTGHSLPMDGAPQPDYRESRCQRVAVTDHGDLGVGNAVGAEHRNSRFVVARLGVSTCP